MCIRDSRKGIITASTNAERIGDFHESGYKTAESGVMGVVSTDDEYRGTKKGINYPIIYDGNVMGVIGITGEPTEVERYGFLITKISEVFIRENFQKVNSLDERRRTERLVFALKMCIRDRTGYFRKHGNSGKGRRFAAECTCCFGNTGTYSGMVGEISWH